MIVFNIPEPRRMDRDCIVPVPGRSTLYDYSPSHDSMDSTLFVQDLALKEKLPRSREWWVWSDAGC